MFKKLLWLFWLAADEDSQDNLETENLGEESEITSEETAEESTEPEKFVVDGEELTIEQLREYRQGFMRQSDYTRKTQEIARARQEHKEALELYEYLRANPEIAQRLQDEGDDVPQNTLKDDPRVAELDMKLRRMEVESALSLIKKETPEADDVAILNIATQKRISVEDAYEIWKGKNLDTLIKNRTSKTVEQIKQNGKMTKTLMTPASKPVTSALGLSDLELSWAKKLDMTPEDYKRYKTK